VPWQPHVAVPPDELAQATCARLADAVAPPIEERGVCHLAVSGGSTPLPAWDLLATMPLPWPAIHVWQVDERIAPDGDPQRNALGLVEHLTSVVGLPPSNLHLMPVTDDDLDAAAARYAAELAAACGGVLDVVHLGLGPDGHTASWVPGDSVADVEDRDVALTATVYEGTRRMTLTVPCVNRARARLLAVGGADKADAMASYLARDGSIPASRLSPMTTVLDATGSSAF
jgi:6-phosphogluconolactonase